MSVKAPRLELKETTPEGTLHWGVVERSDHVVRVLVDTPEGFDPDRDDTIVMSHGLTGTAEAYRRPSGRFCKLGYRVVRTTFDHFRPDHLWHPIKSCAEDTESVIESFELSHYWLLGHSMGTVANLLAVPHLENQPEALVQVNAAMLVPHTLTTLLNVREIAAEIGDARGDDEAEWVELVEAYIRALRSPKAIARIGAQAFRLAGGKILHRYRKVVADNPSMTVVGVVTPGDAITPYAQSKAALEKIPGVNVVSVGPSRGRSGHLSFCRDAEMAESINNEVNAAVVTKRSLKDAA